MIKHPRIRIAVFVLSIAVWACGDDATGPGAVSESTFVVAALGDTVEHTSGARLFIQPGELSQDALVTLTDEGYTGISSIDPVLAVSRRFVVELGGARALAPLTLELDFAPVDTAGGAARAPNVAIATRDIEGRTRLRAATVDASLFTARIEVESELSQLSAAPRTFECAYVPSFDLVSPPPILQTPYYWQDSLPWCVPTSLAMVLNFYDMGFLYSNFFCAGADTQDAASGNSYVDILKSIGVPKSSYSYLKWDADLIPGAPFVDYVKLTVAGYNLRDLLGPTIIVNGAPVAVPDVDIPPRPPALSSTTTSHAFVGVGANNASIWLHDPSGAFSGSAGIADELTWSEFRTIAMDATSSTELRSLVLSRPIRPGALRRGSIVLEEGTSGTGSLTYETTVGTPISNLRWDGDPFLNGYSWDDPTAALPNDPTYGNNFLLGSLGGLPQRFSYSVRVANVTSSSRTYTLEIQLSTPSNIHGTRLHEIVVPAYTWKTASVTGTLEDDVPIMTGEVVTIRFQLLESGEIQDAKVVRFRAVETGIGG